MYEERYKVTCDGVLIAENMSIETTVILLKALFQEYYNEEPTYIVAKMERIQGDNINYSNEVAQ